MFRIVSMLFFILMPCCFSYAHVGSPGVIMEGTAGPYKMLVTITPPDVIPGIARVTIFFQNEPASMVTARAVYFRTGDEGSPGAEQMKTVAGQPGQFNSDVWLMNGGSSSIQITVKGKLGNGVIVVPVVAVSKEIKKMPFSTGLTLSILGVFLFILMVTVIGSSVSDALTKAGEDIPLKRKKFRRIGISVAILLTSAIAFAGNAWWKSWIYDYNRFMFRPLEATSNIKTINGANELIISLDTTSKRSSNFSFVVPDHGKLMHMFIVRFPSMDAFAHLHPVRMDSANYRTILPALPKGKYLVFADIVYTTGFAETIKDTVNIAENLNSSNQVLDKDDGYAFAPPVNQQSDDTRSARREDVISCGMPGTGAKLKDGSTMVWEGMTNEPYEPGKLYQLKFSVLTPDNKMASLESYLGMQAHAAIIRNDGNVYIHLHPVGTFSMAAETNMLKRIAEPQGVYKYPDPKIFRDSIDNYMKYVSALDEPERENLLMTQMGMNMPSGSSSGMNMAHNNRIEFPYSFPSPGRYRIWVQVKCNGQILTGAFDKEVK